MAKKKPPPGRVDPESDSAGPRKALGKEAWVAIGTIAAALITGAVTLLVHLLPPRQSTPAPIAASSTPTSSPSPTVTTADAIAGKWAGIAKTGNGAAFQITLEINKSCKVDEHCGSISVSHVPCYGEVFLEKVEGPEFEFRVTNFFGQSNRAVCQPGGGEHFKLRPDGKLAYSTTYEPKAEGLLERKGD